MSAIQILGLAASVSLLAGWRLYACVAGLGLAMRMGWVDLPSRVQALDVLANPWVIGAATIAAVAELFADKVMWVDSVWDAVHTAVRPIGGALLALAIADPSEPAWQVAAFILGGGAALLTHTAKAGTRAAVNASPEPFSNVAVSAAEDFVTLGGLWLALANPTVAIVVAIVVASIAVGLIALTWRMLAALKRWFSPPAER